ncbi:NAD(P)-binding domain-containing protein [Neoactinobaculum massilliense]|uniref:NAD(P)-binding domain-containing protein n=1 Tax=Neoactinobaculum massilliense TaxID=2364794 RepID=UPI000F53B126|nr:NAD(P)-binding domain-containing protein [Neoactinobaculum massilliense]
MNPERVDIAVIGAGQSGLAMAHELLRRGFIPAIGPDAGESGAIFVVLDANPAPGGAWQHRWPSLTMATVNGIAALPGLAAPPATNTERSSVYVPRYFAEFERVFRLPILRPVTVTSVAYAPSDDDGGTAGPGDPASSDFVLATRNGTLRARVVINCTGTWNAPFIPSYPGHFAGRQVHSREFGAVERYRGERVLVVGGGISALDHLSDLDGVAAHTDWVTRTPPRWQERASTRGSRTLTREWGHDVEARVRADVEAGRPVKPVVANTGLPVTPRIREMRSRGLLNRMPMFTALTPRGARWADGTERDYTVIVWATGFRPDFRHLTPLHIRNHGGGVTMRGQHVAGHPRLFMVGYGPSASTLGARWASRKVGAELVHRLDL